MASHRRSVRECDRRQYPFVENQRMFLDRNGYLEETFFTFSFSPLRDETGRVAGIFNPCTEVTAQCLAERRLRVLREVSDGATEARTVKEAADLVIRTLKRHQRRQQPRALTVQDSSPSIGTRISDSRRDNGGPRR